MKNQLLGSYKGSSTPQRRGWAGMGATGHSGRLDIPTPNTQQPLLGVWIGLELPDPCANGQGVGCCILVASPPPLFQAVVETDFVGSYAGGTGEFNPIVKRTRRESNTHTRYYARPFKTGTSSNL